ncbi:hypothetical protein MRX96_059730 [Rhipicephalus microplus]
MGMSSRRMLRRRNRKGRRGSTRPLRENRVVPGVLCGRTAGLGRTRLMGLMARGLGQHARSSPASSNWLQLKKCNCHGVIKEHQENANQKTSDRSTLEAHG